MVSTLWKMTINRNLVKKAAAQPEELRHGFHPKANDGPELILSAQTAPCSNVRGGSFDDNKIRGSNRKRQIGLGLLAEAGD